MAKHHPPQSCPYDLLNVRLLIWEEKEYFSQDALHGYHRMPIDFKCFRISHYRQPPASVYSSSQVFQEVITSTCIDCLALVNACDGEIWPSRDHHRLIAYVFYSVVFLGKRYSALLSAWVIPTNSVVIPVCTAGCVMRSVHFPSVLSGKVLARIDGMFGFLSKSYIMARHSPLSGPIQWVLLKKKKTEYLILPCLRELLQPQASEVQQWRKTKRRPIHKALPIDLARTYCISILIQILPERIHTLRCHKVPWKPALHTCYPVTEEEWPNQQHRSHFCKRPFPAICVSVCFLPKKSSRL